MRKEEFNELLLADEKICPSSPIKQVLERYGKSSIFYNLCRTFYLLVYNANIIKRDHLQFECYISDDDLIPAACEFNETVKLLSTQYQAPAEEIKEELFNLIKRYYTCAATPEELDCKFRIVGGDPDRFPKEFIMVYDMNEFPNWDHFEERIRSFV
ncbi:hypothetical protein [Salipaludibacillus aurantiacus]|uniref:Uncharacterized protein n=1 Tax=Salipaludibacillus aurantiacus TaxID=1601833 RepID=A0A1H9U8K3_9BACI|nr:hypothetical protein [Salipaludibacillus aurantiacus]SES05591.1 hypothetical protein SAMN05518684_10729 [Salipaludibacillus aurantiacus]